MSAQYEFRDYSLFVSNNFLQPIVFVPFDLDTSGFLDVTCVGDTYAKLFDPSTGITHDCKDYWEHYRSTFHKLS
jgi:hypothetical protein